MAICKNLDLQPKPISLLETLSEDHETENDSDWEIYHEAFRGIAKCKCIRIGPKF